MKNFALIACLTLGLIFLFQLQVTRKKYQVPGVNPSPAEPRMYKK